MQLVKQSLSIFVSCSLITSQCLYAADLPIAVDTTSAQKYQATLDKAPNGVQIVNIVNPNSSGMSHNKFKEYNVNPTGLILNNSTNITNTQLAGYISFNPNLSSNAKVILNEVTGTNKSLLKGYTEIAGIKADVIVANPNGITVNGGGFINTNKATLTTGNISYLNGLVNGFDISKGQILIEGDEFNVNNIDKVELYSKALQINAKFYANNLKVATGENTVSLDGKITSKDKLDSGVSIDSSLLGGIYANTIELVSSDKGVGVNLPPEVSAQDSLSLSASGEITLSKIEANNTIEINSRDGNINSNSTLSADTLTLKAKETLTNNSSMEGNNVSIEAKKLENKNNVYAKNDVVIKTEDLNNGGLIQADDDINITTTNLTNKIDSTIYAKNDNNIIADQLINDGLFVSENLNINAKIINNKGALYSIKDMYIKAENLTNLEMIRSNSNIDLLVSNELINDLNGVIYADGNVNISANEQKDKINTVINKGLIQSENNINITAKKLENTATTPTYKNTTTSSAKTISRGGSNDYDIVNTTTVTQSVDVPSDPALILSGGDINIDVDTLNNFYSLIASDGNIVLNANQANNVGKILISTTTTVTNQYRDEKYCASSGPSGACFNHKNRAAYRGSFTTTQTTKLPVPNYGIQAKRNITGNVINLSNTNGSAADILTNQEIAEKQNTASTIEANAISLQKLTDQLDTNNETKTFALGTVTDMTVLVNSILTEEDFTAFKTDLSNLENSIQTSIDQDKLDIASIEAIITYTKNLTMTDTLSAKIANLELALQTLKDNVNLNENNIATFKNINESILAISDITLNKNALLDIDSSVRSVISDNSTLINNLTANNSINTIVLELENISDTLYAEVKQSLALQEATTKTILTNKDGLYQTNSNNSLQSVNNVSYNNKVLTSDDVINFNVLLPDGKYGLFVLNKSQKHPYLIESNPLYTSYAKFIGSDYMLGKLNYKPENTIQRLGDGLYETNLVRDSILKLTGQRYLDGFSSDVSQFQALMDNALSLQEGLNLSYGITLSKEQVSQLNKDIVWMEERIVNNQKVLVPIVYLATINKENMIDGAKITAGENINLTAQNNIINQGLISSNKDTNIQAINITNQGGVINSNQNISLNASNNIDNISGNIKASNNIELNAQNNINLETMQYQKTYNYGSGYQTVTNKGQTSTVQAGGNINGTAGNSIILTGGNINANNDISLKAKNDVAINSLEMNSDYNFNLNNGYNKGQTIKNLGSTINANNISVDANTLNVKSSNLNAKENIGLNAVENINILATNDLTYQDTQTSSKGFLSKKTQRDMTYKEEVVSSNLNAKNILINSDKDVTLEATKLKADENIIVNAKDGDVNILAKEYREGELHQTSKSSFGGLKKSLDISSSDALKLNSALLETQAANVVITSGKDINILASEISSGADIQLKALNDVLIASQEEYLKTKEVHEKSSFNIAGLVGLVAPVGGSIYTQEIHKNDKVSSTNVSTNLKAKENIIVDSGSTTIVGSNLEANNISIKADTGEINILSSQDIKNETSLDKKIELSLSNPVDMIKGQLEGLKDGQTKLKFEVGSLTYDEVDKASSNVKNNSSNLIAKENIVLDSLTDINIQGSNLKADENLVLNSTVGDINILNTIDTYNEDIKEKHAKAALNLTVQNEYVETAQAVKAAVKSAEQLKQTKDDYSNYKGEVKKLENTLSNLKQSYKNKEVGVDYSDIEDLIDIIDNLKSQEKYYVAAIAAATADLASKTVAVATQAAAAATSSGTLGFSAGVSLDVNGEKSKQNLNNQTSNASNLNAKNIIINTDEKLSTNTNITGSNVIATENLYINTNNLNVKASQDNYTNSNDSESVNGSVAFTMYGGGGGTAGLGYGQQNSNSNSIINNNSQLIGNNVNINASNDAIFQGANVKANEILNLNVGNNLVLESLRDEYSSNSNGFNVNAGIGFGSAGAQQNRIPSLDVGKQSSTNAGFSVNNGTILNKQTVLSSITGNEVNVNVGNNTHLKGALLASGNYDENGNFVDNKNLNFSTNTLTFENLSNSSFSSNQSIGGNFNYNLDSTKIVYGKEKPQQGGISSVGYQAENSLNVNASKTLATLGQGNINIKDTANSDDLERLNTDTTKINKDLYSVSTGTKVDAVLDTRLLTKTGQDEIKQEYKDLNKNMVTIAGTLPDANSDNKIEATTGEVWNALTKYLSIGIIPSNENKGGILANIPILTGNEDSRYKALQVVNTESPKYNENDFVRMEDSAYYKSLTDEDKAKFDGKGLYVSKNPVVITKETATYQNSVNGMMNSEGEAIKNGLEQTGQMINNSKSPVELNVNYNPSYGFLGDVFESFVDKSGIGTTGIAKQIGIDINETITLRGNTGTNYALHSQANAIVYNGIEYIQTTIGFQPKEYFNTGEVDRQGNPMYNLPSFVSFGSPMNGEKMNELIGTNGLNYNYLGAYTKPSDFVGEVLGGNKGNNQQATILEQANILNVYKLFTSDSPHSTYVCQDYEKQGLMCGYK